MSRVFAMRCPIPIPLFVLLLILAQQVCSKPYFLPTGTTDQAYTRTSLTIITNGPYANHTNQTYFPPITTRPNLKPETTGTLVSSLETEGNPSIVPFPTPQLPPIQFASVPEDWSAPSPVAKPSSNFIRTGGSTRLRVSHRSSRTHHKSRIMQKREEVNCFAPLATSALPQGIQARNDHPAQRIGINQDGPVSTNKFYVNFFLGNQSQGVWTHPYSLTWSKGGGTLRSWGMAVSHIDSNQRALGPTQPQIPGAPVRYFINPIGIQPIILSAIELGPSTKLSTRSLQAFSVNTILSPQASSTSSITFPCVQGMAFVTALYNNLMPTIQSAVLFRSLTPAAQPQNGVFKYRLLLEDNKTWLLYVTPKDGRDPRLSLVSNSQIQGVRNWSGTIQVSKSPGGACTEPNLDASAGIYPTKATITGSVSGATGAYRLQWTKSGLQNGQTLLMYALPHHLQSFDSATAARKTSLQLQTTTKGVATAISADVWSLTESSLPVDISFAPWTPSTRSRSALSSYAKSTIGQIALAELSQNIDGQTNLDSMYFSGKALSKFATIVWTTKNLLQQPALAQQGLQQLKIAFQRFSTNKQIFPLVYDSKWGGLVSSAAYKTGDPNSDFGNSFYNDHHFHYGYFIHAAAVIGSMDSQWLQDNRLWVDSLIRDAGSPSSTDPNFPFSRAFDWYHGHSFAKGLFESADGKDEESTGEDAFFAYAVKMWGKVTGDASTEARGNLMLAIMARTFDNYFLMKRTNQNQPSDFIANKVTGILFENKVDHATYFGANPEYIQGIHMLPLSPSTAFTRSATFINEEWSSYFSDTSFTPASRVAGGWRGILYGNLACINPQAAWKFFSQENFDPSWIDGGASRTWYLAFAATLGGI